MKTFKFTSTKTGKSYIVINGDKPEIKYNFFKSLSETERTEVYEMEEINDNSVRIMQPN